MSEVAAKPRLTYAQFIEGSAMDIPKNPTLADFKPYTWGWCAQRYIEEMNGLAGKPPVRVLGETHLLGLRAMQRRPIARKLAAKLKKQDIILHCQSRIEAGVSPATVNQDITFMRGVLKYAGSAPDWDGCDDISDACIAAALPFLQKNRLIGKSARRKRRPTDAEIAQIIAKAVQQGKHPRGLLARRMPDAIEFGLRSSRRISEVCRITHGDVDYEKKIYWVRDLKHPTKKQGNDKCFILWPVLAEIIKRQPRISNDPSERIFPLNSKSFSTAYAKMKRDLGIQGLRLHDNRGEAITRWRDTGLTTRQVRLGISGHDTDAMVDQVYDRGNAEDMAMNDEMVAAMMRKQTESALSR